jgi:hypothetical protein
MDLETLINETADRADDLLSGVSTRKDGRTVLKETLASDHPEMEVDERSIVIAGVMRILDDEDFFAGSPNESDSVWGETAADAPDED